MREHPTTTADMRYKARDHALGYAEFKLPSGGEIHVHDGERIEIVVVEERPCYDGLAV